MVHFNGLGGVRQRNKWQLRAEWGGVILPEWVATPHRNTQLENPEINNQTYTFSNEFEAGSYSIESISLMYDQKEYQMDLNEKFDDLSFEVEEVEEPAEKEDIVVENELIGAFGKNEDNLTWCLDDDGLLTIYGSGEMEDFEFGTSPWYESRDLITSVSITAKVTNIGDGAFYDCYNLGSVTIPSGVTSIGDGAFSHCSSLADISIPDGVAEIGSATFEYCTSLETVTLPSNLKIIGFGAFSQCSSLTSIDIPYGTETIAMSAFDQCSALTTVTMPNTVTSLGGYAFYMCSKLKDVTIPSGVTSIYGYTFYECYNLGSVTIPSSVTSIGYNAFDECYNVKCYYLGTEEQWLNINFGNEYSYPIYYSGTLYINGEAISKTWSVKYDSKVYGEANQSLTLTPKITGTYTGELKYKWNNGSTSSSYTISSLTGSSYCTCTIMDSYGYRDYVYYNVSVKPSWKLDLDAMGYTGTTYDGQTQYNFEKYVDASQNITLGLSFTEDSDTSGLTYTWKKGTYTYYSHSSSTSYPIVTSYTTISDCTGDSYTFNLTTRGYYQCRVSDAYGNSNTVSFSVGITPKWTIDNGRDNQTYNEKNGSFAFTKYCELGDSVDLAIAFKDGSDTSGITYKWAKSTDADLVEGNNQYSVNSLMTSALYVCQINDAYGNMAYVSFTIKVNKQWALQTDYVYYPPQEGTKLEVPLKTGSQVTGLTYTWYDSPYYGNEISNTESYIITDSSNSNGYSCVVTDSNGDTETVRFYATSSAVEDIGDWKIVADSYEELSKCNYIFEPNGTKVDLKVNFTADSNTEYLTYTWYDVNGTKIDGVTTSQYSIQIDGLQTYRCMVMDTRTNKGVSVYFETAPWKVKNVGYGTVYKDPFTGELDSSGYKPKLIDYDATVVNVKKGGNVSLKLEFEDGSNTSGLTYQWCKGIANAVSTGKGATTGTTGPAFENIEGETSSTLNLTNVTEFGEYCCKITDSNGNYYYANLYTVKVEDDWSISSHVVEVAAKQGEKVELNVPFTSGSDTSGLCYYWSGDLSESKSKIINPHNLNTYTECIMTNDNSFETTKNYYNRYYYCQVRDEYGNADYVIFDIKASARSGKCGDNLTWVLDDEGTLTITGSGDMYDYEDPLYSSALAPWYDSKDEIKSVILPNGITNLGKYAFTECSELTSITIPTGVTDIKTGAFEKCIKLTSITIPDGVENIYSNAFAECSGLTSATIADSVKSIGMLAFDSCTGLTSIKIPSSMTIIAGYAFRGCSGLKNVIIPDSVTGIGWCAFASCTWLTSIKIPSSVTVIDSEAFVGCSGLTSIIIPKSVTTIYHDAFDDCSKLKTIYLYKNSTADSYFDDTYTKIYLDDIKGVELEGYSLSLSGSIGVNFYMSLYECSDTDYMLFTLPNNTTQKVNVSDAYTDDDYTVFTCNVSAKDMTSTIKAQLMDKNGKAISEEYQYTVEEYVNYLINNASAMGYSNNDVSIAKAMLTYGYYTQNYFGYNTSKLPATVNTVSNTDLSSYAYKLVDTNDSIKFVGARLVLTSKPGLKLYFNADANVTCAAGTISTEGKYKVITISNIDNIYKAYKVTGTNFSLEYSIASYGNIALNGSNDSLKNLIKAMVAYYNLFN